MNTIFIALVKIYRKFISPLKPSCCRFNPTCSQYAVDAFSKYGFFKALIKTIYRVMRCNPFCKGGYDPA